MSIIGINPNLTKAGTTTDGKGAEYKMGGIAERYDGSKWIYFQAGAAIAAYQPVFVTELGQGALLTSALALTGDGVICFPQVALADNAFGWGCIDSGSSNDYKAGVLSACDSNVTLMTSGTAGYLDDTYTTFVPIHGVIILTTLAATGGATAIIRNPRAAYGRQSAFSGV